MVRVELAFLNEIGRVSEPAERVLDALAVTVGLKADSTEFERVAQIAANQQFSRDPFDRIITAQALAARAELATKDRTIRHAHPKLTIWD